MVPTLSLFFSFFLFLFISPDSSEDAERYGARRERLGKRYSRVDVAEISLKRKKGLLVLSPAVEPEEEA